MNEPAPPERQPMPGTRYGPDAFAREWHVSRETMDRLERYAVLLKSWQTRINLVSEASLHDVWNRHFRDSAQLVSGLPDTECSILDAGSGAGFPGLVLAALRPDCDVTLVEATAKKCAFLQEVVAQSRIITHIQNARVEKLAGARYDIVVARACAPLDALLRLTENVRHARTVCLFPKGAGADDEIRDAHGSWTMTVDKRTSLTDPRASILRLTDICRV